MLINTTERENLIMQEQVEKFAFGSHSNSKMGLTLEDTGV